MKKINTSIHKNKFVTLQKLQLLLILLLPLQMYASEKRKIEASAEALVWQFGINSDNLNINRAIFGTDIIFKSSFEPVPILSMTASPENINSGDSSTISWTLSNNTDSCIKSGDWSGVITGSAVTNGTHSTLLTNITTNSIYKLQCANSFGDSQLKLVNVVMNSPPVISNFIASPSTVPINGSSILSWTLSNNADSCIKSGYWSGVFTGADVANGNYSMVVTGITNDLFYTLNCFNTFGISPSHTVQVLVNSNITIPALSNFRASPSLVPIGGSTTLSWSLTGNAISCSKSGSWSGTLTGNAISNGNHEELVTNITANSTYNLQCSNNDGQSVLLSVTVSIIQAPDCSNQPPILNGLEDLTLLSNGTGEGDLYDGTYDGMTSGSGWPGVYGELIRLTLTQNQYVAAVFHSGNNNSTAKLLFVSPSVSLGPPSSGMAIAISECPGDFNTHLNQPNCLINAGGSPNFKWSTNPNASAAIYCKLEKNKIYYLNIVHSNNSENNNYATSGCLNSYCGILATQVEVNF